MNIKYNHGITEQGKEMLITEELEDGTISQSPVSGSGWTLRRRGFCVLAVFSFCVFIILAVTGELQLLRAEYLAEHFSVSGLFEKKICMTDRWEILTIQSNLILPCSCLKSS